MSAINLSTKSARAKLAPQWKPYRTKVGEGKYLGYVKHETGAGPWLAIEYVGGGNYKRNKLGEADDVRRADGKDVLTYEQALRAVTHPHAIEPRGNITVKTALANHFAAMTSKHAKIYEQWSDKRIVPTLGTVRVDRLTLTQLKDWQTGLVRDDPDDEDVRRKSMDTANRVRSILVAALNAAYADEANGITSDAAWRRLKPFKAVSRNRQSQFEEKQVRALIKGAASFDQHFADLCEVAYRTGARLGELANANVEDANLRDGTLHVDGKTGPRTVSLAADTVAALRRISKGRDAKAPLLPRADGERWQGTQHRPMQRAIAEAKLDPEASFYTLRHSHISRAIEAGMPLSLIAEQCGTSLLMLQRNYSHVLARTRRATVESTAPKLRLVK